MKTEYFLFITCLLGFQNQNEQQNRKNQSKARIHVKFSQLAHLSYSVNFKTYCKILQTAYNTVPTLLSYIHRPLSSTVHTQILYRGLSSIYKGITSSPYHYSKLINLELQVGFRRPP